LKHASEAVHPKVSSSGRLGYEYYNRLGYVPDNVNIGQSAARTLEYAYNDWAIYQLGKTLGKPESEIAVFAQRALNYRNVYNPQYKLMTGRNEQGQFDRNFVAEDWSGAFCEGNSWHWSFCVFHDPQGLMNIMGGQAAFNQMLDSIFIIPGALGMKSRGIIHEMREMQVMNMEQYAHGNQPIQHLAYLYNYSGQAWKSQSYLREIMQKLYSATPDGYCGDEDNGQTSAWYVFSAMGFYPVCPGSGQYILGSPLFKSMKVRLENGKTFDIQAPDNSEDTPYIQSLKINGKKYDLNYLTHENLLKGGVFRFEMSKEANRQRGMGKEAIPYSFTTH
jgi:predicted alpha-1,2-mannosidase